MAEALTVLGPIPARELGVTITHEHLLIDFRCRYTGSPESDVIGEPFDPRDRWRLVREPAAFEANLLRQDLDAACDEVDAYKRAGGSTIVDATTEGLGPDANSLRRIAERTGAHIIASTGIYVHRSHADRVHRSTVGELADRMIRDIVDPEDGIPRGFIGEIGVDGPAPCELKVVRAAAAAQRQTGAPVSLHLLGGALPEARPGALEAIDAYIEAGGDPEMLIAGHHDGSGDDPEYQDRLLDRGITLEYDTFGFESVFVREGRFVQQPTDTRRVTEIADLWRRGWGSQVVLSQDVCYRMMAREWGGWGIAHILETVKPRFAAAGIGESELRVMMVDTPARLLAFA